MSQAGIFVSGNTAAANVQTLTGNNPLAVGPSPGGNINIVGNANITVTGNAGTNTLTISDSDVMFTWTVVTSPLAAMASNTGYIANNGGTCLLSLPAVSIVGDIINVTGINNATGWKVTQAAGQQIFFSTINSTLGAGGSLQSSSTRDSIEMVCIVANTTWQVISSIGNVTYV